VTVRRVVPYPARILKGIAGPVGEIGPRERALAQDLVDTMYGSPGCVGLAAPQLGVASRAFALDVSVMRKPPPGNHGLVVLFDPELVLAAGSDLKREGCMSVPDYTCDIRRATDVVVRGTTPEGEHRVVEATGSRPARSSTSSTTSTASWCWTGWRPAPTCSPASGAPSPASTSSRRHTPVGTGPRRHPTAGAPGPGQRSSGRQAVLPSIATSPAGRSRTTVMRRPSRRPNSSSSVSPGTSW
jgi:peptide deformylase